MGEEDEEFAVIDHSLTSDGIIEEYYVQHRGQLVAVPADEARVVVIKEHGSDEEHGVKPKKKKAKKLSKKKKKSKNSPPDDDGDGVPDWADKKKGKDKQKAAEAGLTAAQDALGAVDTSNPFEDAENAFNLGVRSPITSDFIQ